MIEHYFHFVFQIEEQQQTIAFELESLDYRPDFEPQLTDLIHAVRCLQKNLVFLYFFLVGEGGIAAMEGAFYENMFQ